MSMLATHKNKQDTFSNYQVSDEIISKDFTVDD